MNSSNPLDQIPSDQTQAVLKKEFIKLFNLE